MAEPTDADENLARAARKQGHPAVTARGVRLLRERHCISDGGKGGRGNTTPYTEDDLGVVCAVADAKTDPAYKNKLYRAVLIAYWRNANINDPGLRQSYLDLFAAEAKKLARKLNGGRTQPDDPDVRGVPRELLEQLTYGETADPLHTGRALLPLITTMLDTARDAYPDLDLALQQEGLAASHRPPQLDEPYGGLARDHPGRPNAPPDTLPPLYQMLDAMSLPTFAETIKTASREHLDMTREAIRVVAQIVPTGNDLMYALLVPAWLSLPSIRDALNTPD